MPTPRTRPSISHAAAEDPLDQALRALRTSDTGASNRELARYVIADRVELRALNAVLVRSRSARLAFLLANGLRCYARASVRGPDDGILACGHRPNERRALAEVRAMLGAPVDDVDLRRDELVEIGTGQRLAPVGSGTSLCADPGAYRRERVLRAIARPVAAARPLGWCELELDAGGRVAAALTGWLAAERVPAHVPVPATWPELVRFARAQAGSREVAPAMRAVELAFYHVRLGELLDAGRYRAAVISSYTNPWGLALYAAARERGVPVVLATHGVPLLPYPALDFEVAIVDNAATRDALVAGGSRIARTVIKTATSHHRALPRCLPDRPLVAGLFLSKDPVIAVACATVQRLLADPRVGKVLVRPHPASTPRQLARLLDDRGVSSGRAGSDPRVVRSEHASCLDDLATCDLVVAGNSSVHVDALAAGVPTMFVAGLDGVAHDGFGLLAAGLVYQGTSLDELVDFYQRPAWQRVVPRYIPLDRTPLDVARDARDAFASL